MKIEVYQDTKGEWRWRAKAGNGRIVADSGEGYSSMSGAERAIKTALKVMEYAPIRILLPKRKRGTLPPPVTG